MTELRFNLVETVAFATAILWLGMFLRKRISFLSKYNIPAPVIGGVIFALASWRSKTVSLSISTCSSKIR